MFGLSQKFFTTTVITPLPPEITFEKALSLLHDYESLSSMSPKWRKSQRKTTSASRKNAIEKIVHRHSEYWEVEEAIPWIPQWLWNGTAKYDLEFTPISNGCDVTNWANWRFTSINQWRLLRGWVLESGEVVFSDGDESGWLLRTVSDTMYHRSFARCLKRHTYAGLKAMHVKLMDQLQGSVS